MDFSKSLPRLRVPSERFPLGNGIFLQQLAQRQPRHYFKVNAGFGIDAKRLDRLAYSYANDPYRGINATLV